MNKLLLLFSLFLFFVTPALADDPKEDGEKGSADKAISSLDAFYPSFVDASGNTAYITEDLDQMYLVSFVVNFPPPGKTPVSYRISWSARSNGTWRSASKPNTERAGNAIVKADEDFWLAPPGTKAYTVGPATLGKSLKLPVGQSLRVKVRAQYRKSKGPWSKTIVINYPADPDAGTDSWAWINR